MPSLTYALDPQREVPRIEHSGYQFRDLKANKKDIRLLECCGSQKGWLTYRLIQFEYGQDETVCAVLSAEKSLPAPDFLSGWRELVRPPYLAISYEWGNENDRCNIMIDGVEISVTRNLHDILLQLQTLPHLETGTAIRWIWVDALCIQQDGLAMEKHALIPNMQEVYRQADAVYAWIGRSTQKSRAVMKQLKRFEKTGDPDLSNICPDWPAVCDDICWVNLSRFARRSFWRRLWIVQEITLARRVKLVCGNRMIDFEAVEKLLACIDSRSGRDWSFLRMLCSRRKDFWNTKQHIKLLSALWLTRDSLTKAPTDRVYALLAMTSDWGDFLEAPRSSMSGVDLNLHMAHRWMRRTHSLDLILLSSTQKNHADVLPSWCPDILDVHDKTQEAMIDYLDGDNTVSETSCGWQPAKTRKLGIDKNRWQTTRGSQLSDRSYRRATNNSLQVKGVRVDRVKYRLCAARSRQTHNCDHLGSLVTALCLYDSNFKDMTHCKLFLRILFWADSIPNGECPNPITQLKGSFVVSQWLNNNRNKIFQGRTIQEIIESGFVFYTPEWHQQRQVKRFGHHTNHEQHAYFTHKLKKNPEAFAKSFHAFRKLIHENLQLVESESGELGWATENTVEGDEIYLFKGCSLPVALRPITRTLNEVRYVTVGRAYLPNLMTGSRWDDNSLSLRDITLL